MKSNESEVRRRCIAALAATLFGAVLCAPTHAMIYHPVKGAMWDPSVLYHNRKYYAFMMYDMTGVNGLEKSHHCLLATSHDGVHWEDQGVLIEERERSAGALFLKCFVAKCGDKFIMNHGVYRSQGNDTLRFHESTDLTNWKYLSSSQPDTRWYVRSGRWDHMYILPKEEGNAAAGYWGYVVSVPKESVDLPGMMQSPDGLTWEAVPPAKADWGKTPPPPRKYLEYGGCERIDGKYYLIGGVRGYMNNEGYSMFTLVADGPRGPFRPDAEAFRLSGASRNDVAWLASWVRGNDELLISNYVSMLPEVWSQPWMLPLRKPVVDERGHLRLGWWKGNEALKGQPRLIDKTHVALSSMDKPDGYDICSVYTTFSPAKGMVFEGKIKAQALRQPGNSLAPTAGFVLQETVPGRAVAIQLGIGNPEGRETHIGLLTAETTTKTQFNTRDVTGKGCATVTGIEDGKEHSFRLLCRMSIFELYIDDLLMQTYRYQPDAGQIGFVVRNAAAVFSNLKAWDMSLSEAAGF